jgi:TPR repeat protein
MSRALRLQRAGLIATLFALASPANADRLAVVIGNQDYAHVADLANARRDAEAMATRLRDLGFLVLDGYDLDRDGFEELMRRAILNMSEGDDIVFFYAGHGIQIGRRNYLLPVNVQFETIYDLPQESITLDRVIDVLSARGSVHLAIVDACRDNPFPDSQLIGSLDVTLFETRAGFEVQRTPVNSLVAFSTSPGMVALDGAAGGHSPYTAAILDALSADPAREVTGVFSDVRAAVYEATSGRQVPWEQSTLIRPFSFARTADDARSPATLAAVEDAGTPRQTSPALPEEVTLDLTYDRVVQVGAALAAKLDLPLSRLLVPVQAFGSGGGLLLQGIGGDLVYRPVITEQSALTAPAVIEEQFEALIQLGDETHPITINARMTVEPCDMAAGDLLDLGGVGYGRLANEINIPEALRTCTEAVRNAPGTARFTYQLARAQRANGQFEEAVESLAAASEAGHVRANTVLGIMLTSARIDRTVYDIPLDTERAHELWRAGIAAGDPYAMHALGQWLFRNSDSQVLREEGFELLSQAAELGHTFSLNELGYYFLLPDSPHRDPARGMVYLNASAERGDIYGYNNLAHAALNGLDGLPADPARALPWFLKAAEGGHPNAPANIGRMIVRGQVPGSGPAEALEWYDIGLARGDAWGGANGAAIILHHALPGLGPADALARAAKAVHLPNPWPAAGFVDTGLGSHSSFLERHRAEIAQLGMPRSRGVVEALRCNRRHRRVLHRECGRPCGPSARSSAMRRSSPSPSCPRRCRPGSSSR